MAVDVFRLGILVQIASHGCVWGSAVGLRTENRERL